ncbi:MAG: glycyl-radical enzyme activating protein [Planctomycetota bacterium]|jgi:pyruvate formate lyase activating enzyme
MTSSGGNIADPGSTQNAPGSDRSGGRISGYVFDIKKYAIHDGPGIRTTVFFKGCSLKCKWCHNPESWRISPEPGFRRGRCQRCGRCVDTCKVDAISLAQSRPATDPARCEICGECVAACLSGAREIIGEEMTVTEVMSRIEKDVIFYDQSGGGATFSGGEPLMQPEFLLELLRRCRKQLIHTAVDTTCYAETEVIAKIAEQTDLFLCDIKHMDPAIHRDFTGVENDLILYNIRWLSNAGKRMTIRIPIIPGFNSDRSNIEMTAEFVKSLDNVTRIDVLPYNSGGREKSARLTTDVDLMETEIPSDKDMIVTARILSSYGFEVKIGG